MAPKATKRRSPGEGSVWAYQTKAGERWAIGHPSFGTRRNASGWGKTKRTAQQALRDMLTDASRGELVEPSKQKFGAYGAEVIDGLRVKPQTKASYIKNWRNHIAPYPLADVPLAQLTGVRLTAHYRVLEKSGRKDHKAGEPLSARTVRYIHTIIHGVLGQAVKDALLQRNPADAATPPTAREAKAPEMTCWSSAQLAAFLGWSGRHAQDHALWHSLAYTGMRRGEALSLRWRDIDPDAATVRIRRSAGIVRIAGERAEMIEDDTKSSKPRVVDLDPGTVAVLKAWRKRRGSMALQLARDDALVFGDVEGDHRNGEHVSRQFKRDEARFRKALGENAPPEIRLHDLRHSHATILLTAREPIHVVSQRLGHASPVVTMTVYAHVLPGSQREAADLFARLVGEAGA